MSAAVIGTLIGTFTWFNSLSVAALFLDPIMMNKYLEIPKLTKVLTSLFLPNSGLYWSLKLVSYREAIGSGATWENFRSSAIPGDNIVLPEILACMVASFFLYGFFIFYLDNTWPWQLGIPKHPLFLFQVRTQGRL